MDEPEQPSTKFLAVSRHIEGDDEGNRLRRMVAMRRMLAEVAKAHESPPTNKRTLAEFAPRQAIDVRQRSLFTMSLNELEDATGMNAEEMKRLRGLRFLTFDVDSVTAFDETHRIEIEFVGALIRAGLSDAWVEHVLTDLPKPLCYDQDRTFYSFSHAQWVTLPSALDPVKVVGEHLAKLEKAMDWASLRELRDRIVEMIPGDEVDG